MRKFLRYFIKFSIVAAVAAPFILMGIFVVMTWDGVCMDAGLCKAGTKLSGCIPCGDSCVISKTNCSALGGKWDNGHNACQLGFEQREPAVCAALGGKWDKTSYFKCNFTDHCNKLKKAGLIR